MGHDFAPVQGLVGGVMIAGSLAIMLLATGRIAGLSGVFAGFVRAPGDDGGWRAWFVAGMLGVGLAFELADPATFDHAARLPLPVLALAGVLVGVGTRLANGCTSGHGLCGTSRLAKRSILATLTFFAVGVATATIAGAIAGHA
ncbi:MAG TPA: YeeE/YedE thiosulfate transporter family protein [Kofleriaceae bacterium]|nr:YeeE/YedE thiosulfate transporter family protein [Kofleriaceae bacterium]